LEIFWTIDNGERSGRLLDLNMATAGSVFGTGLFGTAKFSEIIPRQKSFGFKDSATGQGLSMRYRESSQLGQFKISNYQVLWKPKSLHYGVNP